MSEKVMSTDVIVVPATELAKYIGVGTRQIRRLAEEGLLIRTSNGRYKLQESVYNYILNLKVNNQRVEKDEELLNLDREKAKHEKVKREMAELKLALMKGSMHKSEDVQQVMVDMLANFKTRCLALPAKVAPSLVNQSSRAEIQEALQKEMNQLLCELKDYSPKDFYGKEFINEEEEEDGEEDGEE